MTTDSRGNVHAAAGGPRAGQFSSKRNAGPAGELAAAVEPELVRAGMVRVGDRVEYHDGDTVVTDTVTQVESTVPLSNYRPTVVLYLEDGGPQEYAAWSPMRIHRDGGVGQARESKVLRAQLREVQEWLRRTGSVTDGERDKAVAAVMDPGCDGFVLGRARRVAAVAEQAGDVALAKRLRDAIEDTETKF